MTKRVVWSSLVVASLLAASNANAATYYVRADGDDSADGRSHATAWKSIGKVNSFSFSAGDAVLFREGDTWTGQLLTVDWGGTTSEHAVVGAYYLADGKPVRGYKTARPTIDGEDRIPSSSRYASLITVTEPRVRVENLALVNSEGRGITFAEADHGQAVGLYTSNTYFCGIAMIESHDGLVEKSHVIEADRSKAEGSKQWCSAITSVESNRTVIRGNIVERSYGEGINTNYGSRDTIIEDNLVFAVRAVGIYADSAPSPTIRRNIVLGTKDSTYWRVTNAVGSGIVLNNETYSHLEWGGKLDNSVQTTNARVYDNLVAYVAGGIAIWGDIPTSSFNNTLIFNNTLVDNNRQFGHFGKPMPSSLFANNIMLSISEGTNDVSTSTVSGLTTRNNYYSKGDPGGMYSHSGNRYSGLQLAKMSGWRTIDAARDVSAADFAPLSTSSTNGGGDDAHLALAKALDTFGLDFYSKPHNDPVDMGAIRFASPVKTPKGPSGVAAQPQ